MKHVLTIVSFILLTPHLFACLSASQNRLFPLGMTSKGLCVLETHLQRSEHREKGKKTVEFIPVWSGFSYFKIYDRNYKEIHSELIDTIVIYPQKHYDSIINNSFKKCLILAAKYPDFLAAKPMAISFCGYQASCSKASLIFDTLKNKISIRLENKKSYSVKVLADSGSYSSNILNYYSGFDDADLSAKGFKGNLYINSVRHFQIGNKKLSIVHLGIGQNSDENGEDYPESKYPDPLREYKADFSFKDINKSIFQEIVLHHGHGFDFYIWE